MSRGRRPVGVRAASALSFAGLALLVSALLSVGTYLTARHVLVEQRERTVVRQAALDAALLRRALLTSGVTVPDALSEVAPGPGTVVLVRRDGRWYSSSLEAGARAVPEDVASTVSGGNAARAWTRSAGGPAVVVGIPVPAVGAEVYEIVPTTELQSTLSTLAAVLAGFAVGSALAGALVGAAAARRLLRPLRDVAAAAARVTEGRLATRLPETTDPDLRPIVGSFNTMVDSLDRRIRRDERFAADVAHELRSPVTTMMTTLSLLGAEGGRPDRRRATLALLDREVRRLHRSLEHLLELGRLDAGVVDRERVALDPVALVRHTLAHSGRSIELAVAAEPTATVLGSKEQLHRALSNLLENAEIHGEGADRVVVRTTSHEVEIAVVDHGPGVAAADRERVFERFARSGSRRSTPGTGLGLSLVARTAEAHGGRVRCEETPGGGATFVLALPVEERGGVVS